MADAAVRYIDRKCVECGTWTRGMGGQLVRFCVGCGEKLPDRLRVGLDEWRPEKVTDRSDTNGYGRRKFK